MNGNGTEIFDASYGTSSILYTTTLAVLAVWLVGEWRNSKRSKLIASLPTVGNYPILGSTMALKKSPSEFYQQRIDLCERFRKEKIYIHKIGKGYTVHIFTADQVEKLAKSHDFVNKSINYNFLHKWLGRGLLTSAGTKWKCRRRMLTPTFHFNILKDALGTMNNHVSTFRDQLLETIGGECSDKPIDMYHLYELLSLDIVGETAMGVQLDALHSRESEYIKAVFLVRDSIYKSQTKPWWKPSFLFKDGPYVQAVNRAIKTIHDYSDKVIQERKSAIGDSRESGKKYEAFLDTLLHCRDADGNPLSDRDIREEVDTFMFEGHDGPSSALGFTTFLLGLHPEEQEKCYQELQSVAGATGHFTMEDLSKMTYLDWCIKESLRLFPPIPSFGRAVPEDIELAGHTIPKGFGSIIVAVAGLHRDPQYFPQPEKFDPTRFSPENCAKRHPYAYIPFSAGPRNCIGQKFAMMELKVVLATMLLTFRIKSVQKEKELKLHPALVLQPANGILVELTARDQD